MVADNARTGDTELTGPDDLIALLAAAPQQAAAVDADRGAELAAELDDHLELVMEAAAPAAPGERAAWLLQIERLDRARRTARHLAGEGAAWAQRCADSLERRLAAVEPAVQALADGWELGALIEQRSAEQGAGLLPWRALQRWLEPMVLDGADPERVLGAWFEQRLGAAAAAWLVERVAEPGPWREAYRRRLRAAADAVAFVHYPPELSAEPFFRLSLPHLGAGARLEAAPAAQGTVWRWPGREPVVVPEGEAAVELAGDQASGALRVGLEPIAPTPLQLARRLAERAGELAEAEQVAADALRRLIELAAGWLEAGRPWRRALQRAAEVFEQALDLEDDDPTVEWVSLALETRVQLDRAAFRLVDSPALSALRRLDESLAGLGDAVLLLAPERYEDLMDGEEPLPGAWWAARAELDADVPEELVGEALAAAAIADSAEDPAADRFAAGELAEGPGPYGADIAGRLRAAVAGLGRQLRQAVMARPAVQPAPAPVATGALPEPLAAGKGHRVEFEALDGSWEAMVRFDEHAAAADVKLLLFDLPAEATRVVFCGLERPIERLDTGEPQAVFDQRALLEAFAEDIPTLAVVLQDERGQRISLGKIVDEG